MFPSPPVVIQMSLFCGRCLPHQTVELCALLCDWLIGSKPFFLLLLLWFYYLCLCSSKSKFWMKCSQIKHVKATIQCSNQQFIHVHVFSIEFHTAHSMTYF